MSATQRLSAIACLSGTRVRRNVRSCRGLARHMVLTVDRTLRKRLGIFEFCQNPDCALRIAQFRTKIHAKFPDGTSIPQGTGVIELHVWNEHVETLLAGKASLVRAKILQREMHRSLQYLARYVRTHPKMADAEIIHARLVMPIGDRLTQFESLAQTYGFSVNVPEAKGLRKLHDYFEDCLVHALVWTFNPHSFGRKQQPLQRLELWMGRNQLLNRYLGVRYSNAPDNQPMEECPARADSSKNSMVRSWS